MPMRTRTLALSGHSSAASAHCASIADLAADEASSKATKSSSPRQSISFPPASSVGRRMRLRWRTSTDVQRSSSVCASSVDLSRSVNRKVTVPLLGRFMDASGSGSKLLRRDAGGERPACAVDCPTADREDEHCDCDCTDEELELHG